MPVAIDDDNLHRLLEVGRSLVQELDPEAVLRRILEAARDLTGARYVALGVLSDDRTELERFVTLGIDPDARATIGAPPRGRGVLGELIARPQPLRLAHVAAHPRSYGFPEGHPTMDSFLGAPVMIRGEAWGNLYLADKQGAGEFTEEDEAVIVILADFAATAIDNARMYTSSQARRIALEQAVQGLEAARDIADAIGTEGDLQGILELVVRRGRALVDAQSVIIMLREGDELVVSAVAGRAADPAGVRLPIRGSTSGAVLRDGRAVRIADVEQRLQIPSAQIGVPGARTALLAPIIHNRDPIGVLAAFDRGPDAAPFTGTDEQLLRTFAASVGNAVAISRSVEADRLRTAIASADAERARWARELHDQTLQALAGLRVGLSAALRRHDAEDHEEAIIQAISDIELEIANLRGIIADLRPSLLDDLGLADALSALVQRRRGDGLTISAEIDLAGLESVDGRVRAVHDLETAVYRIVQESLTNIVKHARADTVRIAVTAASGAVTVSVQDNGRGFDTGSPTAGFGVRGIRERVFLLGGTLTIDSGAGGTVLSARIPFSAGGSAGRAAVGDGGGDVREAP